MLGGKLDKERYEITSFGVDKKDGDKENGAYWNMDGYDDIVESNPDIVIFNIGCSDEKSFNWTEDNFTENFKIFVGTFWNLVLKPKVYLLAPPITKSDNTGAF